MLTHFDVDLRKGWIWFVICRRFSNPSSMLSLNSVTNYELPPPYT